MAEINCPKCGKKISDDYKYCPYCGKILNPSNKPKAKIWWILFFWAFIIYSVGRGTNTAGQFLYWFIGISIGLFISIIFYNVLKNKFNTFLTSVLSIIIGYVVYFFYPIYYYPIKDLVSNIIVANNNTNTYVSSNKINTATPKPTYNYTPTPTRKNLYLGDLIMTAGVLYPSPTRVQLITSTPKPPNVNSFTLSSLKKTPGFNNVLNDSTYWLNKSWKINGNCLIKGNISFEAGEYIYYVPGWKDYDATEINTSKGERWFCTEQEALNAGWRPPYYIGYRW